jgi:esterase/lipase
MDMQPIPKTKKKDAKKVKTPIYMMSSSNDLFFPADKVFKRAKKIFANVKETIVLENSKHIPSTKDMEIVLEMLRKNIK